MIPLRGQTVRQASLLLLQLISFSKHSQDQHQIKDH